MRVLLSWIGGTDLRAAMASSAPGDTDIGPLWRLLREKSFDQIHLLNDYGPDSFQGLNPCGVEGYACWLQQQLSRSSSVWVQQCADDGRPADGTGWEGVPSIVVHDAPRGFRNQLADTFAFTRGVFRQVRDRLPAGTVSLLTSPGTMAAQAAVLILSQTLFGGRATLYSTFRTRDREGIDEQRLPFVIPVDVLETTHVILREPTSVEEITEELNPAFEKIRGSSRALLQAKHTAQRMARVDFPVLILGEPGTGKELFADAIHKTSPRRDKPFIPVNCGALDHELVDSELFGHAKGAFTSAHGEREGKFEAANGGTIFLDEMGLLPLRTQAKLLRILQDGVSERLGENKLRQLDVRVIAATNADLWAAIAARTFREDLYYRLAVLPLTLPPLAERGGDLAELAAYFLDNTCRCMGVTCTLSPDAVAQLYRYPWRGNVRELQSVIQRLVVLCDATEIRASDIEAVLGRPRTDRVAFSDQTVGQYMTQLAATIDELLTRYEAGRGLPQISEARDLLGELIKPLIFGRAMHLKQGDKEAAGRMFKDGKLDTSPSRDGPKLEVYTKLLQPHIDEHAVARLRGVTGKEQR